MIVIDTSAVMAILFKEVDASRFIAAMLGQKNLVGAATLVECYTVAYGRMGGPGRELLENFINGMNLEIVAFDGLMVKLAADAYATYGKGSGHPAQLNLGDTFSYALAKTRNIPLLFKGNDFTHTDITPAFAQVVP